MAGSDSHIPEMVGQAYTEIDAEENTVKAVLKAIREGKVAPPAGKNTPTSIILEQMSGSAKRKIKRKLFGKS